jgi:hypothetical protein
LGNPNLSFKDCLPNEEVECFDGYTDEGKEITVKLKLKETISSDGSLSRPLSDYLEHMMHSEELIVDSHTRYDPFSLRKEDDPSNIDYVMKEGSSDNAAFKAFFAE